MRGESPSLNRRSLGIGPKWARDMPLKATVITDASFCHQTRAAGWAAWVSIDGHFAAIKMAGATKVKPLNSTFAEIYAALNGIWLAHQHGADTVLIQSDCMTVIHLVAGRCKNTEMVRLWTEAMALIPVKLTARHVKGHNYGRVKDARTFVNDWCDKQAYFHMEKGRDKCRSAKRS